MTIFKNKSLGDVTRGGQTTIHFLRMILQVVKQFLSVCIMFLIVISLSIFFYISEPGQRYVTAKWVQSYVLVKGFYDTHAVVSFTMNSGKVAQVRAIAILNESRIVREVNKSIFHAGISIFSAFALMIVFAFFLFKFIKRTGHSQSQDDYLRGAIIVSTDELKEEVKQRDKEKYGGAETGITIAGVPLPIGYDVRHIIIAGSPGTGKSVTYREILSCIRKIGKRAVVYDVSGDFVKYFYREGKDVILNPLDARSPRWDPWSDCHEDYEFRKLAQAFIYEEEGKKDFFTIAARMVFSSIVENMQFDDNPSIDDLVDILLRIDIEEISKLVEGTDAASILNEDAGRMATSVRGVIAANCDVLKKLKSEGKRFSIKEWIENESEANDSWLFITSNDAQLAMLAPLITVWLDIVTSSLMCLSPDDDRRIFLMIDELPSLNVVPSLENFLAQARKYGGCGILGFQNYPQLVKIYGKNGADSIADLCTTWIGFKFNGEASASWLSKNLGQVESVETAEGMSFGVNDIRDGVNLNRNRRERSAVTYTEIIALPDLHGYIRFGGGFPLAKFESKGVYFEKVSEPFIANKTSKRRPILTDDSGQVSDSEPVQTEYQNNSEGGAMDDSPLPPVDSYTHYDQMSGADESNWNSGSFGVDQEIKFREIPDDTSISTGSKNTTENDKEENRQRQTSFMDIDF